MTAREAFAQTNGNVTKAYYAQLSEFGSLGRITSANGTANI